MSKLGYKKLVEAAEARIRTIAADEAIGRLGSDDVVFVDLRDVRELKREAWRARGGETAQARK